MISPFRLMHIFSQLLALEEAGTLSKTQTKRLARLTKEAKRAASSKVASESDSEEEEAPKKKGKGKKVASDSDE
jgi:hypothetical protein